MIYECNLCVRVCCNCRHTCDYDRKRHWLFSVKHNNEKKESRESTSFRCFCSMKFMHQFGGMENLEQNNGRGCCNNKEASLQKGFRTKAVPIEAHVKYSGSEGLQTIEHLY